ncbi:hypothetical protein BGY98DRAFT_1179716 [Russula aff. rugulosa BPL654]|nr:hypothetical protein BGY98DRAFT_1179716 [Russula aff. rugulosa BPL654]
MPFDPSILLILEFGGSSVVVPRKHCSDYDEAIAVAQRNLRSLQSIAQEDIVLMARIPDYPDKREVEVSKEAWPLVCAVVQSVTINGPVAAAIDQPVLFQSRCMCLWIIMTTSGDYKGIDK